MPKGVLSWRHCKKLRHNVAQRIGKAFFRMTRFILEDYYETLTEAVETITGT